MTFSIARSIGVMPHFGLYGVWHDSYEGCRSLSRDTCIAPSLVQQKASVRWTSLLSGWRTTEKLDGFLLCLTPRRMYASLATSARSSPPSVSPAAGGSRGSTFELPKPRSSSHEALAFSPCPLCHAPSIHLHLMKSHLMAVHRGEFDEALFDEACKARLDLYEEEIGNPLPRPDEAELRRREIERQAQLPTVTAQGHYVCNWCLVRLKPFSTRDAFLQHVAVKHPEQDMDEVEKAVPPPSSSSTMSSTSVAGPISTATAPKLAGTMGVPMIRGGLGTAAGVGPTRRLPGVQPLVDQAMQDLQRITTHQKPSAFHSGTGPFNAAYRSPRQSGISVPRSLDARGEREVSAAEWRNDKGGVVEGESDNVFHARKKGLDAGSHNNNNNNNANGGNTQEVILHRARSIRFGNGRYPCELCGRALVSELDLLQHLEMRHPEVNAPGVPSGNATSARSASAGASGEEGTSALSSTKLNLGSLMRAEMGGASKKGKRRPASASAVASPALAGQIVVSCDLCSSSKVYTLASALFAHIRFKHPAEDAAFHVERLIEASKHVTQRFICSYCSKAFSSEDALQGHISSKHQSQPDSPTVTRNPATAGLLGVVAEKNQWWCNECEKGFRSGRALLGHKVSKHLHDLKSHNCPACKRVFTDVFSLEEHMKQVHPTLSIDDLGLIAGVLCQYCDRRFLEVKDLQQHLLRHHPGKSTLTREVPVVGSSGGVGFLDPLRRNTVSLNPSATTPSGGISPDLPSPAASRATTRSSISSSSNNNNNEFGSLGCPTGTNTRSREEHTVGESASCSAPQNKPRKVIRKKM